MDTDDRPNFPYSKRQRIPKRDSGDMVGGLNVLLPRSRRVNITTALARRKDEVEADSRIDAQSKYLGQASTSIREQRSCVNAAVDTGMDDMAQGQDTSAVHSLNSEETSSSCQDMDGVDEKRPVQVALDLFNAEETSASDRFGNGLVGESTKHGLFEYASTDVKVKAVLAVEASEAVSVGSIGHEELGTRGDKSLPAAAPEIRNEFASIASALRVASGESAAPEERISPILDLQSSSLDLSSVSCAGSTPGVRHVPCSAQTVAVSGPHRPIGGTESCYAASLFVCPRPHTTTDGNQGTGATAVVGSSANVCQISATVGKSMCSTTPLQPANQNNIRCTPATGLAVSSVPSIVAPAIAVRVVGCGNHRCPACGRELSTRSNLNKHLRSIHGNLISEWA